MNTETETETQKEIAHLVGAESEEEGLGAEEGHHLLRYIGESGDEIGWEGSRC
jgi:hypothetical protein